MKKHIWPLPLVAILLIVGCQGQVVSSQSAPTASPTVKKVATAIAPTRTPTAKPVLPVATPKPTSSAPAIVIANPKPGDTLKSPATIAGTARVFEGTFQVTIKDAAGKTLANRTVQASLGAPEVGTFNVTVPFTVTAPTSGTVEAFDLSAKDGSTQNFVSVKVNLVPK